MGKRGRPKQAITKDAHLPPVRIQSDKKELIDWYCAEVNDLSVSDFVRQAISNELNRRQQSDAQRSFELEEFKNTGS